MRSQHAFNLWDLRFGGVELIRIGMLIGYLARPKKRLPFRNEQKTIISPFQNQQQNWFYKLYKHEDFLNRINNDDAIWKWQKCIAHLVTKFVQELGKKYLRAYLFLFSTSETSSSVENCPFTEWIMFLIISSEQSTSSKPPTTTGNRLGFTFCTQKTGMLEFVDSKKWRNIFQADTVDLFP